MSHLKFSVEYTFDSETKSVIANVPELNYISSFGKDFAKADKKYYSGSFRLFGSTKNG